MKKIIWGSPDFEKQLQALYDRPAFPPAAEEAARQIIAHAANPNLSTTKIVVPHTIVERDSCARR